MTAAEGPTPAPAQDVIDELFGLPLEHFVARRNEAVARLRAEGNKAAAEELKALRKPSLAAWTVNQLARRHADEVARLVELSTKLRHTQQAALGGGSSADVRALSTARHGLIAELTERADEILAAARPAAARTQLERVTNTLLAATGDDEASARLLRGRLVADEAPSGFGPAFEAAALAATPQEDDRARARQELERRAGELRRRAEAAVAEALRLENEAREAEAVAG
ncbi:MAG: hypothetical protein ABR529_00130, partial [Actinomycetota bacterium]